MGVGAGGTAAAAVVLKPPIALQCPHMESSNAIHSQCPSQQVPLQSPAAARPSGEHESGMDGGAKFGIVLLVGCVLGAAVYVGAARRLRNSSSTTSPTSATGGGFDPEDEDEWEPPNWATEWITDDLRELE